MQASTHRNTRLRQGLRRFLVGLGKKVILADNFALLVRLFRESSEPTVLFYWMYAIAFALNIYFDFSGYSDMAIGLGRVFGFRFIENFNYPYLSKSVAEFWRRWHMSLGSWFRDYVYIPMGGNRVSRGRWVFNILTVWMLTGLWHGASWNFVLWGLYYGALLIFEKKVLFRFYEKIPTVIQRIYTLLAVAGGWILFYFTDMHRLKTFAIAALGRNLGANNIPAIHALTSNAFLLILMILFSTPILKIALTKLREKMPRLYGVIMPIGTAAALWISFVLLISQSYNPFLYFRF